jgi:predicted small secreted protein
MKTVHKPTLLTLAVTLLFAVLASGCNTMKGIGKDTERAGEKIQEKASR